MKALVHLPDPNVSSFVSSVRLEVGDEVGIVRRQYMDAEGGWDAGWVGEEPPGMDEWRAANPDEHRWAVVATSTITKRARVLPGAGPQVIYPDLYRYRLAPLRECPPLTDRECKSCDGFGNQAVARVTAEGLEHTGEANPCEVCNSSGRVPFPEVPTRGVVLLDEEV